MHAAVLAASLSRKNHSWRIPVLPRAKPLEIEITRAKSESNIGAVFKMVCRRPSCGCGLNCIA